MPVLERIHLSVHAFDSTMFFFHFISSCMGQTSKHKQSATGTYHCSSCDRTFGSVHGLRRHRLGLGAHKVSPSILMDRYCSLTVTVSKYWSYCSKGLL